VIEGAEGRREKGSKRKKKGEEPEESFTSRKVMD